MAVIGIHASHEQHPPSRLLAYFKAASARGVRHGMCSDHFAPWSLRQGHSGFSWSWIAAALEATDMEIGMFNAPVGRYHPAVIAQGAATLSEMFPDRFWLAAGSGEFLNEHVTGEPWPPKEERMRRLQEAAEIMRELWAGKNVTRDGPVPVRDASAYSLPPTPPPLYAGAISETTAEWVGGWADGLITVGTDPETLKKNIDAFRRGGGMGKPVMLQSAICLAPTDEEAWAIAHDQWRQAALSPEQLADLPTPEAFDAACADVRPEDLHGKLHVSSSIEQHVEWIKRDLALGFDAIYLHQLGDLDLFLDALTERILPELS